MTEKYIFAFERTPYSATITKYAVVKCTPKRVVVRDFWMGYYSDRVRHLSPADCYDTREEVHDAWRVWMWERIIAAEKRLEELRNELDENDPRYIECVECVEHARGDDG